MRKKSKQEEENKIRKVHKLIKVFQLEVAKIREQTDDPNEDVRNLAVDFQISCASNPEVSDDDMKRVDRLCDRILKAYPATKTGKPRELDMPPSSARLTDLDNIIDENYEPEEVVTTE